jgi:hypothetical protein
MKPFVLRLMVLALLVCANAAVKAQDAARVQMDHLDRLFPNAVETIDVTVDSGLLRMASKFLQDGKPEQAAVKEILAMIKGVYVKGVEFDQDNQFTTQDVEALRQQLQAPCLDAHCWRTQQTRWRKRRSLYDAQRRCHSGHWRAHQ